MNNTLSNGIRLLEMLAEDGGAYAVKELSGMAGLPPSHVCRLLKTLVHTGYLEQGPENRKYRVSLKLLSLSQARLAKLDLRRVGHPFLAQLGAALNAHAFLSAPCRGRSIIIDGVWPVGTEGDPSVVVGKVHSMCHSACGKVCAAFLETQDRGMVEQALAEEDPPEALEAWSPEFVRIREDRLAVRREQGVYAVAAPVFRAGSLFSGAVGAFLPVQDGRTADLEAAVRQCATAISFALGKPYAD